MNLQLVFEQIHRARKGAKTTATLPSSIPAASIPAAVKSISQDMTGKRSSTLDVGALAQAVKSHSSAQGLQATIGESWKALEKANGILHDNKISHGIKARPGQREDMRIILSEGGMSDAEVERMLNRLFPASRRSQRWIQ